MDFPPLLPWPLSACGYTRGGEGHLEVSVHVYHDWLVGAVFETWRERSAVQASSPSENVHEITGLVM